MRDAYTSRYGSPEASRMPEFGEGRPLLALDSSASSARRGRSLSACARSGAATADSTRRIRNGLVLALAALIALGSAAVLYREDAAAGRSAATSWVASSALASFRTPDRNRHGAAAVEAGTQHGHAATVESSAVADDGPIDGVADSREDIDVSRIAEMPYASVEALVPGAVPSSADILDVRPSANPRIAEVVTSVAPTPVEPGPVPTSLRAFIRNAFIDASPAIPSLIPAPPREKHLAFLYHSGQNNQRIALQVAMTLAHMLNRTLLVPPCRLGRTIPWGRPAILQASIDSQQKIGLRDRCRPFVSELERGKSLHTLHGEATVCNKYDRYTEVTWQLLVQLQTMKTPVRLLERPDMRREWLFSRKGLGVDPAKAYRFEDKERFYWKLYDAKNNTASLERYSKRLDIEDLRSGKWAEYELLEFNSLYGRDRIAQSLPSTKQAWRDAQEALLLRIPIVDAVAAAVEAQIGGRGHFHAVHLRVGDAQFAFNAVEDVQDVFRALCSDLGVAADLVSQLLRESRDRQRSRRQLRARDYLTSSLVSAPWADFGGDDRDELGDGGSFPGARKRVAIAPSRARLDARALDAIDTGPLSSNAKSCRRPLYTDPDRSVLNRRVYVATDAKRPLDHEALGPFVHSFPCLFFLSDFVDSVPTFTEMKSVRSKQEGVRIGPFFVAMLDAVMAARGRKVFGTIGSTFSNYVENQLHALHWPPPRQQ